MYAEKLTPRVYEEFEVDGQLVKIPKCIIRFEAWTGEKLKNTFGNKGLIHVNNQPMFAELAIREIFVEDGWESRWIVPYGRPNQSPYFLERWKDEEYRHQVHSPIMNEPIKNLLSDIARHNANSYAGCWDVFAWKNEKILFAECKRAKKDSIKDTQRKWLTICLKYGLSEKDFLIVQWDFDQLEVNDFF